MKELIAKDLLDIKAVFLRPNEPFTWASGIKSPIYCDNRLTLSYPNVRKDIENGLSRKEVVKNVNENIKKVEICFCPDSLEYLKRGGRLSRVSATIGEILKIKPILSFRENTLVCVRKVLGVAKSIPYLVNRIPETAKKIYACCAAGSKHFDALKQKIKERFPNRTIFEGLICPVVTSHVGPAVGVAWME